MLDTVKQGDPRQAEIAARKAKDRARIMIVDDEPRVLRALKAALGSKFEVVVAQEAEEARQIIENDATIEVIVSDERMPRGTGLDLLRWSRENHPGCARILLSSTDFVAKRDAIRAADVYRCIAKPWDTSELVEILDRAVEISQISDRREIEDRRAGPSRRQSGVMRHGSLLVLDSDKLYRDHYKQVVGNIADCSEIYYPQSAEEVSRTLSLAVNIGVVVIDLAIGESVATELIREVNKSHSNVAIIVTSKPNTLSGFMPKVSEQAVREFIAKPFSTKRIQPVVAEALQHYFVKMRKQ